MAGKTCPMRHIESSIFRDICRNLNFPHDTQHYSWHIVDKNERQSLAEAGFLGLHHEVCLSATNSYTCTRQQHRSRAYGAIGKGKEYPLTDRSAPAGCLRARCPCGSPHPTTWSPTPAKKKPPQQEQIRTYIVKFLRQAGGRVRKNNKREGGRGG